MCAKASLQASRTHDCLRKFLYPFPKPFSALSKILELIEACSTRGEQNNVTRFGDLRGFENCIMQSIRACDSKPILAKPEAIHRSLNFFCRLAKEHYMIHSFVHEFHQFFPWQILVTTAKHQ